MTDYYSDTDDFASDLLDARSDLLDELDEDMGEDEYGNVREWCGCGRNFIDPDLSICTQCWME